MRGDSVVRERNSIATTASSSDKPLERIGWLILGLIYLWLRDSELPLTQETGEYLSSHFRMLKGEGKLRFSSDEIVDFIYEYLGDDLVIERLEEGNG